ncbi:flagellar biosynthesis repressor FlbT [Methylobacterium sp. E-065]|uniref:flagellar biosynthesis repressor FlbT n=1 Tax=Methylobacterium sp. E-065 TaxID=2836583 RepID=UPI001FBAA17A|nr:flagellar biosynthesis repressor FlbT [Methylobacterium sp. E-065]MCJ2021830.1 flagellar biosynthesis repressor FlbT [Methylobacterium sp. E-065]
MPLRIIVKPQERLIVNGAVLRNGGSHNITLIVETQCQFLREGELISESEADTPCKKLCLTLQVLHLSEDPADVENLFFAQAVEVMRLMPSAAPILLQIQEALAAKQTYAAVKFGKQLMLHERELPIICDSSNVA